MDNLGETNSYNGTTFQDWTRKEKNENKQITEIETVI